MEINLWGEATLSGATDLMFSSIKSDDYSIEHIIIVPDRFSLLAEKKLLNFLKNGILFNVKVTTFSNFAMSILEEKGLDKQVLSVGERLLMVSKAVNRCKEKFVYFKKSNINFCDKILKTISLLQSSNVQWQDLEKEKDCKNSLKNKLHDIALIYKEYSFLLGEKMDSAKLLDIAFSQSDVKDLFKNRNIYLAQFDSFTAQMYNSIKFFAQNCKSLNISFAKSFNYGNDYIYEKDIEQKVSNIAKELNCKINVIIEDKTKKAMQKAIIKGLYSFDKEVCQNNIYQSYVACNKRQEIEGLAKFIASKVRGGAKYNDFEIAVGNLDSYKNVIEEIFTKYNFSYYIDAGITANQTVFARCIFALLDILNTSYSFESLLNFYTNPIIKLWNSNEEIIEKIIKYNIDGRWKFENFFDFKDACSQFVTSLKTIKTNIQLQNFIDEFIKSLKTFHKKYLEALDEKLFYKEKNIEQQVLEIVEDALSIIFNSQDEKDACDLKEFSKQLELLLQFKNMLSVPTVLDGIMVGDASDSFFEGRRILCILGAHNLPKTINDNSLLTDIDISNPIYKKVVGPTTKMINRRNRFALFNLLSSATDEIYLSYIQFDDDGNLVSLPLFVDQLNYIFNKNTQKILNTNTSSNLTAKEVGCLKNLETLICNNQNKNDFVKHFSFKDNDFKAKHFRNLIFTKNKISVSQLESYFSCPFKHFARYGLKLKEEEKYSFEPSDVGNLCHKAVEMFVQGVIDGIYSIEYGIVDRFIAENFDKILFEEDLIKKIEILPERKGLENFLKFQIRTILNNVVLELSNTLYSPKFVEYKIEEKDFFDDIDFMGKIDRIDVANDYFRILDYKTGHVGSIVKDLYYGDKLQLFLYANLIRNKLKRNCGGVFYFNCKFEFEDIEKGKSLLKGIAENDDDNLKLFDKNLPTENKSVSLQLGLSNAKNKTKNYIGRAIAKRSLKFYETYAKKVAQKAIQEIKSCFIMPKPDSNSCQNCKYSSICLYSLNFGIRQKEFNEKKFLEDNNESNT